MSGGVINRQFMPRGGVQVNLNGERAGRQLPNGQVRARWAEPTLGKADFDGDYWNCSCVWDWLLAWSSWKKH